MDDKHILLSRDFSPLPGGRFREHRTHSGEEFREDYLIPLLNKAIKDNQRLIISIDIICGSAFLEESFGSLAQSGQFSKDDIEKHLQIEAFQPLFATYQKAAEKYINEAFSSRDEEVNETL